MPVDSAFDRIILGCLGGDGHRRHCFTAAVVLPRRKFQKILLRVFSLHCGLWSAEYSTGFLLVPSAISY